MFRLLTVAIMRTVAIYFKYATSLALPGWGGSYICRCVRPSLLALHWPW